MLGPRTSIEPYRDLTLVSELTFWVDMVSNLRAVFFFLLTFGARIRGLRLLFCSSFPSRLTSAFEH